MPRRVPTPPTLADQVAARARRLAALKLRCRGWRIPEIAEQLGVSEHQVARDLRRALDGLDRLDHYRARQARLLDLERLDGLLQTFYPRATAGEPTAAHLVLAVLRRRAELLGYDAAPGEDDAPARPMEIVVTWRAPTAAPGPAALPPAETIEVTPVAPAAAPPTPETQAPTQARTTDATTDEPRGP
jgi:AraC-like DNA-binding protein